MVNAFEICWSNLGINERKRIIKKAIPEADVFKGTLREFAVRKWDDFNSIQ